MQILFCLNDKIDIYNYTRKVYKKMSGSKIIKQIMLDEGLKIRDVANMMDMLPATLSSKLWRDSWTMDKLEEVLDVLGYELVAVKKGEMND